MSDGALFAVWCLLKPVAMAAAVAVADMVADGVQTPIAELSPLAATAGVPRTITLNHLQQLSLPLTRTGLMEGLCREEADLRVQLLDEIAAAGASPARGSAFHSEYTLWRVVGECLESLTGRQPATALNNLLDTATIDAQFSLDPASARVDRLTDYWAATHDTSAWLTHSRSGVLLSTWSMSLGGFACAGALARWAHTLFFRHPGDAPVLAELYPASSLVTHLVGELENGSAQAVLGLRLEASGLLVSRGWLGLSLLAIDLAARSVVVVLCNDMSCEPARLDALADQMLRDDP